MKVLTNIRFYRVAGIAQTLLTFLDYLGQSHQPIKLAGVDIVQKGTRQRRPELLPGKFSLITKKIAYQPVAKVIGRCRTVEDIKRAYEPIIRAYRQIIAAEQPDLILINGTYLLPWCLLWAAQAAGLPIVLHYHGVLTKETDHYRAPAARLFRAMERQFNRPGVHCLFPSQLAKDTVEREVFKSRIKNYTILPNPIPEYFFTAPPAARSGQKIKVGIVTRWTKIKNPEFIAKLARYNARVKGNLALTVVTDAPRQSPLCAKLRCLVSFRRPVDNKKLADFYKTMDIVICPSHFETYGNVAQEALASGTPALVGKRMGVAETLAKLKLNHLITSFRSAPAVYNKICALAKTSINPQIRSRLQAEYTPKKIYPKLCSLLYAAAK